MSVRTLYKEQLWNNFFIIYLMFIAYVKTTVFVVYIYLPIRVNVIVLIKNSGTSIILLI